MGKHEGDILVKKVNFDLLYEQRQALLARTCRGVNVPMEICEGIITLFDAMLDAAEGEGYFTFPSPTVESEAAEGEKKMHEISNHSLTKMELYEAYRIQEHLFDIGDIQDEIENILDENSDHSGPVYAEPSNSDIDEMANEKRRKIDKYDMTWEHATSEAIRDVALKKYQYVLQTAYEAFNQRCSSFEEKEQTLTAFEQSHFLDENIVKELLGNYDFALWLVYCNKNHVADEG